MDDSVPVTDVERSRKQRSVLAVSAISSALPITLTFTALAIIIDRAGGTAFEVGMVVTVHFLGLLLFAPVWGALADVTGRRRGVLLWTSAVATATLVLLGLTDSIWGLIGMRGLFAVFIAAFAPLMFTIVSERGGGDGRGRWLGEFNGARSFGFALGQLLAGVVIGLLTSLEIFLFLAGVYLVVLVATWLVEDPTPTGSTVPDPSEVAAQVRTRLVPVADDRTHLRTNGLHYLYVATVLHSVTFFGILSLLPVYLTAEIGVTEVLMGVFLAMNPGGRTVFMNVFGYLADLRGRKSMIVWGLVGSGVFAVVLATATRPEALFYRKLITGAGFLLMAMALSAYTIGSLAFIGDVASVDRESELMGLRDTAMGVGGVVGPALFGGVVTLLNYESAFVLWSSFAFLGAAIVTRGLTEADRRSSATRR